MSRRELLPSVKPATQYHAKIEKIKQSQKETLLEEQVPLIMKAFERLEKDITQPVNITLKQPLDSSLANELIEKGYEIEQIHQYDTLHATPIYTVRISIPYADDHRKIQFMDDFGLFPFSAFFSRPRYPCLTAPEKHKSDVIIEEVSDSAPAQRVQRKQVRQHSETKQKKQVGETRKKI